jgi:phosphate:Na+ symporter
VTVLLALFGGVALLLYGIRLSGEALQRALGARLRSLLTGFSRNRVLAVVSGAAITAIIQSSAATTLMLIGFVAAGLMSFRATLGVILGADIGTTFTVQLIAFRITDYAPLLIGLGFTTTFVARRRAPKDIGQALLGLGLLFLGLKLILDNAGTLEASPLAVDLFDAIASSPAVGVLVGAVLSALVTSSAATLGLALAFAHQGLLGLTGAVAVVLGANIGTCVTALTASIGAGAEAKRVAVAHIAFKLLGVALVFPFVGPFTAVVASTAVDPARQIANAHTLFNIGISLAFLPFTPLAARAIEALVPEAPEGDSPFRVRYVDERALEQPALALGQATREALRMADVVQAMLRDVPVVFASDHQELLEEVSRRDDQVDFLEREIKLFLTRLGREAMGPDLSRKEIALISFIGNLENIGDIIDKNLMELARKKIYQGRRFSDVGWAQIQEFHGLVSKNLERAIAAFAANDRGLAQEVLDQRPLIRTRERDLRESHLGRLRAGLAESIETSEIHLDLLTNLKRVSSHVSALAISIVEEV